MRRVMTGMIALLVTSALVPVTSAAAAPAGAPPGAVRRADFNGDGHGDLAAGVPRDDVRGIVDAGAVNVLYGGPRGLRARGNQYLHQDRPRVKDQAEPGDNFGNAVASGDFDGDGFDDLAVGARQEGRGVADIAGVVHVFRGTRRGLTTRGNQLWHQDRPGMEDEVEEFEEFGHSLAVGDFDGDGFDDLAVGVNREDVSGFTDAGAVHIIYGSPRGLTSRGNRLWHQDSPGIEDEAEANDSFGSILAAGDFNRDGRDDLAANSRFEDIGAIDRGGGVNVLYGSRRGIRARGNQFWHQDSPGVKDQVEDGDDFGSGLAAGDFGKGRHDDLAIGVWAEGIDGVLGAGAVNVLYGGRGGLRARGDQFWHQDSPGVKGTAENSDLLGFGLAAGNLGKSAHDDLAIGVIGENVGGVDAGAVNVLYGTRRGLRARGNQLWHLDRPGIKGVPGDDSFGNVVWASDVGRGRYADLMVDAPFADVRGHNNAGTVTVIYGTRKGLRAAGNQRWHQDRPRVKGVAAPIEEFGRALG